MSLREGSASQKATTEEREKLLRILQRASSEEEFALARLLRLDELPPNRSIALCSSVGNLWVCGIEHYNLAPFGGPEQMAIATDCGADVFIVAT